MAALGVPMGPSRSHGQQRPQVGLSQAPPPLTSSSPTQPTARFTRVEEASSSQWLGLHSCSLRPVTEGGQPQLLRAHARAGRPHGGASAPSPLLHILFSQGTQLAQDLPVHLVVASLGILGQDTDPRREGPPQRPSGSRRGPGSST